eukprot:1162127-Pelagomonas_calceolata.AAC.7
MRMFKDVPEKEVAPASPQGRVLWARGHPRTAIGQGRRSSIHSRYLRVCTPAAAEPGQQLECCGQGATPGKPLARTTAAAYTGAACTRAYQQQRSLVSSKRSVFL